MIVKIGVMKSRILKIEQPEHSMWANIWVRVEDGVHLQEVACIAAVKVANTHEEFDVPARKGDFNTVITSRGVIKLLKRN